MSDCPAALKACLESRGGFSVNRPERHHRLRLRYGHNFDPEAGPVLEKPPLLFKHALKAYGKSQAKFARSRGRPNGEASLLFEKPRSGSRLGNREGYLVQRAFRRHARKRVAAGLEVHQQRLLG